MGKQAKGNAAGHRQPARTDPHGTHFQAKHGNALAVDAGRSVGCRNRQGKGRLAHRRPSGDDDQVARPEAAGMMVKIREAGGQVDQASAGSVALVDVRQRSGQHFGSGDGGIAGQCACDHGLRGTRRPCCFALIRCALIAHRRPR